MIAKALPSIGESALHVAAFGPSGQIVFSPNNHRLFVATVAGADCTKWTVTAALPTQHVQLVSGVDWHCASNRIVSCSHDRTVFVSALAKDGRTWCPTVVMIEKEMTKGCTGCTWNADGTGFFIASALSAVAFSFWDDKNNFWGSRFFKAHARSSVSAVAPHPMLPGVVATGGTNGSVKVFCANRKAKPAAGRKAFGEALGEIKAAAWIHSVTWAPDGTAICVAAHDSSITIWSGGACDDATSPDFFSGWATQRIPFSGLPFVSAAFLTPTSIAAGGFDFVPVLLGLGADGWTVRGEGRQEKVKKELTEQEKARQKFMNMAVFGQAEAVEMPLTRHTNTITLVLAVPPAQSGAFGGALFATASLDGRVELWKADEMLPAAM